MTVVVAAPGATVVVVVATVVVVTVVVEAEFEAAGSVEREVDVSVVADEKAVVDATEAGLAVG